MNFYTFFKRKTRSDFDSIPFTSHTLNSYRCSLLRTTFNISSLRVFSQAIYRSIPIDLPSDIYSSLYDYLFNFNDFIRLSFSDMDIFRLANNLRQCIDDVLLGRSSNV